MGRNTWGQYTVYDIDKVKPIYCGLIQCLLDANMTDEDIINHLINQKITDHESAEHTLLFIKDVRNNPLLKEKTHVSSNRLES